MGEFPNFKICGGITELLHIQLYLNPLNTNLTKWSNTLNSSENSLALEGLKILGSIEMKLSQIFKNYEVKTHEKYFQIVFS